MTRWLLAAWLLAAAAFVGQAPQQPSTTFRSGTTIVEVDVIARDKDGRFVSDLRAEDFEVLEDGVPQEVSVVYRVVGPAEPPPGDVGAPPVPPPQQVQRVLVFFFDHHHMAPGSLERARKAALDFLQRGFREGDVGGVLNGPVLLNNRLTSSREEIDQALRSVKPAGDPGAVTRELRQWPRFVDLHEAYRVVRNERGYEPGASTALAAVVNRACREQPDQCEGGRGGGASMVETQVQGKATQLVEFARSTARQTIDTIGALSNGLGRLPGRKTVVMLTEGFFTEESWADLRSVLGRAARASVRIYAVDTRGLNRGSASSDIISAPSPSQPELSAPALSDPNADAPNSLAADTGGFAIRNENDFGKAFAAIDRDTSSYYILGFRSTKPPDGTFRSLAVRVKRAGIAARARKGYVAAPLASAAEEKAVPADNKPPGEPPPARPAAETGTIPVVPASPPPAPAAPLVAVRAQPRVAEHVGTLEGSGTGGGALPPGLLKS
ncbi:MAG: VWA domain-containing protein, partial [Acidobacteria bacterium]